MRLVADPDSVRDFALLTEHRPDVFARMLMEIPPEVMAMMLRKSTRYEELMAGGKPFMDHFERVCASKLFSHDWFSHKAWAWHEPLAAFANRSVEVLEIGVFEGRSAIFFLEALKLSRLTAVDDFSLKKGWTSTQGITLDRDSEETFRLNVAPYRNRVRTLVAKSWSGLTQLIEERAKFDIVYIDAAHTMPDVMADTLLSWRMLKKDGLLIWDDFLLDCWDWHLGPVGPGVAAFLRTFPHAWEVVHAGWQVIVRKHSDLTELR